MKRETRVMSLVTDDVAGSFWERTARQDIDYHLRQFREPYRSTVALGDFLHRHRLYPPRGQALDVGCGAGANLFYLSSLFPEIHWTGIDVAGDILFPHARSLLDERGISAQLITGDFFKLDHLLNKRQFELVLCIQTFTVLPNYEQLLEQLLKVTNGWLVLTSPFTDFNVDARIEVMNYTWPTEVQGPHFYSVFGIPRLQAFCESRGVSEWIIEDFEIDKDLPVPQGGGLTTYTQRLSDGRRLQFTGPIFLPWKFVALKVSR
jgi:SAM-dependent methyltransferase